MPNLLSVDLTAGIPTAGTGTVSTLDAVLAGPLPVAGTVAAAATDSGNPVKVGGKYNSTLPTYTDGQRGDIQIDAKGSERVLVMDSSGVAVDYTAASPVAGAAAHDAAVSGNPVRIGARAGTADYTAAAHGDTVDLLATPSGKLIVKPYSLPEVDWTYAAATAGISNTTTAVTVKASAGGALRNYITAMQIMAEALGAATEFAIRDGAAGTVLWRCKIGTAGIVNGISITFPTPLRGTAATLLEVVTLTASITGAVFVNLQGYAGV